jgi:hypothetical protein
MSLQIYFLKFVFSETAQLPAKGSINVSPTRQGAIFSMMEDLFPAHFINVFIGLLYHKKIPSFLGDFYEIIKI